MTMAIKRMYNCTGGSRSTLDAQEPGLGQLTPLCRGRGEGCVPSRQDKLFLQGWCNCPALAVGPWMHAGSVHYSFIRAILPAAAPYSDGVVH